MDDSIKAIVTGVTDWNINNKDKYDISKTGEECLRCFPAFCPVHDGMGFSSLLALNKSKQ